jgi:Nucleotide-diphospho-sugar transferase
MNIHVFYNSGQRILLDQYFVRTLIDEWNVIRHELHSADAIDYGTHDFKIIMFQKISILINEIIPSESKSTFFILSDIDIQFFKKCDEVIAAVMEGKDMVFQSERGGNRLNVNTGFIAMRPNEKVLNFWKQVRQELMKAMESKEFTEEQIVANQILPRANGLKWGIFPNEIWAWTNAKISPSEPGFEKIVLHHANGTRPKKFKSSLQLKIEQLELVSRCYQFWASRF